MITSVHTLIYSDDAAATRAFFKDVLEWPFVNDDDSTDPGDWLIFRSGPSEVGVHPTRGERHDQTWKERRRHKFTLMCDDLQATMTDLAARGAAFTGEPHEMGFGLGVMVKVPGADDIMIYQPHHKPAHNL